MRKILTYIFFIVVINTHAQRIQNFSVFTASTSVGIKFTVKAGSQCAGYTIYHSIDSVNFYPIYNYAGICGDLTLDQDYSYTHQTPTINQINYYKIELTGAEISTVRRVYVSEIPQINMVVYPNPVYFYTDELNIRIFNTANLKLFGFLYDQFGKPLQKLDIITKTEFGTLNLYNLQNGVYVIWLTEGINIYSAKFIIAH